MSRAAICQFSEDERQVVANNIGLVVKVLSRVCQDSSQREDLFQEGCLGLMRTVQTHDPQKGSFGTHAYNNIRGAMLRYLDRDAVVTVPMWKTNMARKAGRVQARSMTKNGEYLSAGEIADALGLHSSDWRRRHAGDTAAPVVDSMDDPVRDGDVTLTRHGIIADPMAPCPETVAANRRLLRRADHAVDGLADPGPSQQLQRRAKWPEIVRRRLAGHPASDIANDTGLTPAWVRRIYKQGLATVRQQLQQEVG